jgi:3-isopropylmalate/(R)-2-methylmalate dehydratase small subunit
VRPVRVVSGPVAALDRDSVDTDQIVPKQFLKRIERSGFGEFLFYDWMQQPDFPLRRPEFAGAPILATGRDFGCGSSREHAPWALQDHGFEAIVAESFADIFASNCGKIGLLTVRLAPDEVGELLAAAPSPATIDLGAQTVVLASGRIARFELDPGLRHRLLNGWDDISLTEQREHEIARYEAERERDGPDVLAL